MAGTVMHLVVADRLIDRYNIENPALFYCGNLAPDAIMARENYVRFMKTHTHFKDNQKPYEFRIKENQEIYLKRFMDFYKAIDWNDTINRELYLGYIVHMLVDELYLLNYYEDFIVRLHAEGRSPADADFSADFVFDVDQVDWELVRTYKFKYPMPDILKSENNYEIEGYITNRELESSKAFIIHKNFELKHEKEPLKVTTYEKNYAFIDLCVDRIPEIIRDRFKELEVIF